MEKNKISASISYGPSPRVLDAVLSTVDKYYHEDIVDWHSSKN